MAYLVLSLLFPTVQAYAKCLVSYTNLTIAKTNSRLHLSISGIIKLLLRKREQTPEVSYLELVLWFESQPLGMAMGIYGLGLKLYVPEPEP
jgi:hypothetical protein